MFAGADFVKTSTGKIDVAATPEAAVVMCQAIRDYYQKTGRKVGFKAAGGVRTAEDAALYYTIVEEILGPEWLNTDMFRLGRQQPPFGYRRQGDQVLLIARKGYRGMQQSGFGLLLFVGAPAGRETGCPEHSAGKPNGLPGNLFCRATGLPEKGRGLTISASLNRRHKLRKAATGRRREGDQKEPE